jgi:hypothetical protein
MALVQSIKRIFPLGDWAWGMGRDFVFGHFLTISADA